jgi:hypothetical protein
MRISLRGTHGASARESRVNAQQSRAGSEAREPTPPCTVNLGSVELSIDQPPTSSAVAESVNQVLSKALSDPPEVLSVTSMCCQFARQYPSALLSGLLIKVLCLRGELDGEERLDAGV